MDRRAWQTSPWAHRESDTTWGLNNNNMHTQQEIKAGVVYT